MEAKETKPRAKRRIVTLGPALDARVEALRTARRPAPPASALLRMLVESALPTFEGPAPAGIITELVAC